MLIKIHAQGITLTRALKKHVDSKVRLALGIYTEKIRRIDVFLNDINGPKGGVDTQCKIKIIPYGQKTIVVQETGLSVLEAINICSSRAKRVASRRFDRIAEHNKSSYRYIITQDFQQDRLH